MSIPKDIREASERCKQSVQEWRKEGGDYFDDMKWYQRLYYWLIRRHGRYSHTTGQDTHCFIYCFCGMKEISAFEGQISWCPNCGRGYSTKFEVYSYKSFMKPRKSNLCSGRLSLS